jgi:ribosome maturation factor RimP
MQTTEAQIEAAIADALKMKGLEVVQIRILQGTKSKRVQILLDNPQTGRITLDECADASRTISAILDVEDCISGHYDLEVSSPGIDRPLIKEADFVLYAGFDVNVESNLPVDGRRKFKGPLLGCENGEIRVEVDKVVYALPLSNIRQAKPVVTDALLKAHKEGYFTKTKTTEVIH